MKDRRTPGMLMLAAILFIGPFTATTSQASAPERAHPVTHYALSTPGIFLSVGCSPTGLQCVAAGYDSERAPVPVGLIVRISPRRVESVDTRFPGSIFQAVACTSTRCYVTGHNGREGLVATVSLSKPGPPRVVEVPQLRDGSLGIACVSSTSCVADSNVLVNKRPHATIDWLRGGRVTGSRLTFAGFLDGVACRATRCYAVGYASKKPPAEASEPDGAEIESTTAAGGKLSERHLARLPALISVSCPTREGSCYSVGPSSHSPDYVLATLHRDGRVTTSIERARLGAISCVGSRCFVLRIAGDDTDITTIHGHVLLAQHNQLLSLHCGHWGCVAAGATNDGKAYLVRTS